MQIEMVSWITFCMGIFLMIVGIVIWAGKKLELVHGEDASKVLECDRAAYARLLGIGVMILALAVMAYGVISCFPMILTYVQYIVVGALGAIGVLILIIGYKKYYND